MIAINVLKTTFIINLLSLNTKKSFTFNTRWYFIISRTKTPCRIQFLLIKYAFTIDLMPLIVL